MGDDDGEPNHLRGRKDERDDDIVSEPGRTASNGGVLDPVDDTEGGVEVRMDVVVEWSDVIADVVEGVKV